MSFNDLYDISYHKIGESTVGMVYYGTEIRTNTPVAIKLICKASTKLDPYFMEREATTLLSITHENINRVRGIYESAENLYIVMDLCTGNDVFTHAIRKKYYSEDDARAIIKQICRALAYLHSRHIAHLGIKPENLLITCSSHGALASHQHDSEGPQPSREFDERYVVKLVDVMLSQYLHGGEPAIRPEYISFMAPEILRHQPYSTEPDIYAMGVTTYLLLGGVLPYEERDAGELLVLIERGQWGFQNANFNGISANAKDFITQCLKPRISERITARKALQHPWLCAPLPHIVPLSGTQSQLERYLASLKLHTMSVAEQEPIPVTIFANNGETAAQ